MLQALSINLVIHLHPTGKVRLCNSVIDHVDLALLAIPERPVVLLLHILERLACTDSILNRELNQSTLFNTGHF